MNKEKRMHLPTIMIADDHEDIFDFISDDLSCDYNTLKATHGQGVLALLEKNTVQLIILNIMMPLPDGYELCRIIKSNEEYSHIPIILLTAKSTLQYRIKGLEEGAEACIEKPFSPAHLQAQIQSLLNNRNNVRKFYANSPTVHMNTVDYNKSDEVFLKKINALIHENVTNMDLGVEFLAQKIHMSRPTFYRKIKAISDLTPNDLINISRLKKATELLCTGEFRIFEVAYMVGYNSQTHFGRNFQKQFGITPTEYIEKQKSMRPV